MQRYFVKNNQIRNNEALIMGNDVHHIKDVLRYKEKQEIYVLDEQGKTYLCEIIQIQKDLVTCLIKETHLPSRANYKITIAQALIKKDRFELFLEKATELGIYAIFPTIFKRSIIKIDSEREDKKISRYLSIVKEASEQSERCMMPFIYDFTSINHLPFDQYDSILVCYERADDTFLLKNVLKTMSKSENILVLIGPEGGITSDELVFLESKNAKIVSLGKHILRSETASLFILSAIRYEWEY
ncbi:MAG: 16S rRNA (uracil(1498)-N(3))-methyltransferase [Firmicutes bacterium]|nr:16S rRNA (uracil(1498)-N(3))-methyltransferase [Bacillota bacterium]